MARPDEVPDDHKVKDHTVPMSVWEKIRADAEANGDKEGEAGDRLW